MQTRNTTHVYSLQQRIGELQATGGTQVQHRQIQELQSRNDNLKHALQNATLSQASLSKEVVHLKIENQKLREKHQFHELSRAQTSDQPSLRQEKEQLRKQVEELSLLNKRLQLEIRNEGAKRKREDEETAVEGLSQELLETKQ
mmetsp:Transcript_2750/g.7700  ORF Transcript_2750/g.7700 Transcript_2750/m.7700 type:complete len:144 (+) Transcript_2750:453-884(+)